MSDELIPLADAVRALRQQLLEAATAAGDSNVRFEVGPIEMEFQVVATKEAKSGAEISFKIFGQGASGGVEGKRTAQETQRVKIVLNPYWSEAHREELSKVDSTTHRRRVEISGVKNNSKSTSHAIEDD